MRTLFYTLVCTHRMYKDSFSVKIEHARHQFGEFQRHEKRIGTALLAVLHMYPPVTIRAASLLFSL